MFLFRDFFFKFLFRSEFFYLRNLYWRVFFIRNFFLIFHRFLLLSLYLSLALFPNFQIQRIFFAMLQYFLSLYFSYYSINERLILSLLLQDQQFGRKSFFNSKCRKSFFLLVLNTHLHIIGTYFLLWRKFSIQNM